MMTMEFDFDAMAQGLDKAGEEYRDALDREFQRAGLAMVHKFRDEQLSGRKAGDIALNVRTGNLRDSLKTMVTTQLGQVESTIYNRGAQYWAYHQDGSDRLKKRIFIEEDFERSGEKLYASAVEIAMGTLS